MAENFRKTLIYLLDCNYFNIDRIANLFGNETPTTTKLELKSLLENNEKIIKQRIIAENTKIKLSDSSILNILEANIIDMNKMPLNINSMAKDIPFTHIYNYANMLKKYLDKNLLLGTRYADNIININVDNIKNITQINGQSEIKKLKFISDCINFNCNDNISKLIIFIVNAQHLITIILNRIYVLSREDINMGSKALYISVSEYGHDPYDKDESYDTELNGKNRFINKKDLDI